MTKRLFSFIILITLLFAVFAPITVGALDVSAKAAVLVSLDTNEIIFEKNSSLKLPMASTTKIMTALVALENCSLDETVTVAPEAAGIEGSSVYLYAGEKIKVETLLYALMLESANDAAAAIAVHTAGSIEAFAELMNEKATSMGLENTHFTNPHGLFDDAHYTSALDLAKIACEALKNEKFREIVSTYKKSAAMADGEASRLFVNHNKMLRIYDGAIGVKTGFTKKSGRCLVSAAERDGMTFVAVTLSAPDDWRDHTSLLDFAFANYERLTLAKKGELSYVLPVVGGVLNFIKCENDGDVFAYIKKDDKNAETKVELSRFYFAGIKKGDLLGRVVFYKDGKQIATAPLTASFDVPKTIYKHRLFGFAMKG